MKIRKTFTFDAAHRLDKLPADHKCHHLHGHTYRVDIVIAGTVNKHLGWIVDYAEIAAAWQPLFEQLDHKYLNDVPGLEVPTTEVLAQWIFERLFAPLTKAPADGRPNSYILHKIRVYESSTTYCEVP